MKYWVARLIKFTPCTRLHEVKKDCACLNYSLSLDLEQHMANSMEQIHSSKLTVPQLLKTACIIVFIRARQTASVV
jgi:hypothetical protein